MVLSMERWIGKVAVVTGASSGIGAAISENLVEEGLIVVGLARRSDKIDETARKLKDKKGRLYSYKADFSKEEDILRAFQWIKEKYGPVSILVNNASILYRKPLMEGSTREWKTTFDVNVIGYAIATRESIKMMRGNNIDGHIININSLLGHRILPFSGIYAPSKFAVLGLSETLRLELNSLKSKIKVTCISPGLVDTLMLDDQQRTPDCSKLSAKDIAEAVVYALSTAPHLQVISIIYKNTCLPNKQFSGSRHKDGGI
ncbi:hypothetical protein NQ317_001392 [Molorchus minor]|uniref:Dehydrogenase/reductase SDR family member 11 n=1 Tax=Molorchus minor TaxID=1323400 RepID=A0ABQ9J3T5_9CUCU|nr:hypothetical protein NQ317_001392 [Molorchus minor]